MIDFTLLENKDLNSDSPADSPANSPAKEQDVSLSKNISQDHPLKDNIITVLKTIYDPEIPVNIYDLGLIYEINIAENNQVNIKMTLTSPMCPVAQTFPQTVQDHLLQIPALTSVSVELVWDPPWTKDHMSETAKFDLNMF